MEASTLQRDRRHQPKRRHTAMDDALKRYKAEKRKVRLNLAIETDYSDDDVTCEADVVWVDTYSYLFRIKGREIWIAKAFVVSVEPLDA